MNCDCDADEVGARCCVARHSIQQRGAGDHRPCLTRLARVRATSGRSCGVDRLPDSGRNSVRLQRCAQSRRVTKKLAGLVRCALLRGEKHCERAADESRPHAYSVTAAAAAWKADFAEVYLRADSPQSRRRSPKLIPASFGGTSVAGSSSGTSVASKQTR
jgi:hypothetical protein